MANLRVNKITGTEVFETTGSVQFSGSGDYLSIPNSSDLRLNTTSENFTIEYWANIKSSSTTYVIGLYNFGQSRRSWLAHFVGTQPRFIFSTTGSNVNTITGNDVGENQWVHIAIVNNSSTISLYQNGTKVNESASTTFFNVTQDDIRIGADWESPQGRYLKGHISNLRILKGTALYTKNFTPPTRELTVIPNTVLLCCQSTTRANEERTGKTITVNGNAVANELTPGLLTDVVKSGGSSAITGSVEFDGNDYLSLASSVEFTQTGDFTMECWFYSTSTSGVNVIIDGRGGSSSKLGPVLYTNGTNLVFDNGAAAVVTATGVITANSGWNHIVGTRSGNTWTLYLNGISQGSATDTSIYSSNTGIWIGSSWNNEYFDGFISNLRIIKGTALYTSNFIPPTRELKKIPGTVLLCCKDSTNPLQEETGKTITLNGSVTTYSVGIGTTTPNPRNFTPQVGSDGSVIFDGVTKINSPNYFYLPTGNTEDRGRGRGLFGGGYVPGTSQNTIQFISIQSSGIAQDFGDLSSNMGSADGKAPCAAASATRALFASGYSAPGPVNTIEYVTIATTSNSTDFGDLITSRRDLGACASSTRAVFGGGTTTGSTSTTNVIEYVTIASTGNAISFGTLTQARRGVGSCSSPTRGIWGGGYVSNSPTTHSNRIDYVTIATTGNATTFGDLTVVRGSTTTSCSSSTRGLFVGGSIYVAPASTFYNTIDYITIASTGNATDFGDLTSTRGYIGSCSNSTRGVFGGGGNPTHVNTIEFVSITSTGNATDFGDLLSAALYYNGGCSDSHGGLG